MVLYEPETHKGGETSTECLVGEQGTVYSERCHGHSQQHQNSKVDNECSGEFLYCGLSNVQTSVTLISIFIISQSKDSQSSFTTKGHLLDHKLNVCENMQNSPIFWSVVR